MANIIRSATELALHTARAYINEESIVIDATCGNGHDTLALAKSAPAMLYAFDVQDAALSATCRLLESEGFSPRVCLPDDDPSDDSSILLIRDSHENIGKYLEKYQRPYDGALHADVIMFNLGYLPGGDKRLTTRLGTTLSALKSSLALLSPGGIICITMYSGHSEGAKEKAGLLAFAEELDPHIFHADRVSMLNQPNCPPELLLITRKK